MSDQPLRPAIYMRVSRAEQAEGFSLDAQERTLRAYCAAQGWAEPVVFTDAGRSAHLDAAAKRPAWRSLLAEAESGAFDVVLVHKLDRWARHVPTALSSLAALDKRGIGFVSLSENLSFVGPWGRAMFGILSIFAQLSSDNLSHEVKKGLVERKLSGAPPHSRPYGATVHDNALAVDPAKAKDLARVLHLAAAVSYEAAARTLNAERVPARQGGRWGNVSVRVVVKAGVWLLDQPEPWPSRWLAAVSRHAVAPVRADRRVRDLTGFMRCGVCGGRINYGAPRPDGSHGLQCRSTVNVGKSCVPGAPHKTTARHYEAHVAAWVAALPDDRYLLDAASRLAGADDPALAALAAVAAERRRLRLQHDAGLVADAAMLAQAAALTARERAVAPASRRVAEYALEIAAARRAYPALQPEARNTILRALCESVVITGRGCVVVPLPELARLLGAAGEAESAA